MQPQRPPIKAILYDLDGTLIDHFEAIHRAIVHAQQHLGLPPSPYDKVRSTVGGGIELTMKRLVGPELAPRAVPLFHEYLNSHLADGLDPMPGAAWLLDELHARGIRQAVLTNKSGEASRAVIRHLGWEHRIELILGVGDTPWRKPEPEFMRHALEKLGVPPAEALMVGDSPFDIDAATNASVRCAAIATGSHTREQLLAHQPPPDAVFDNLLQFGATTFGLQPPVGV